MKRSNEVHTSISTTVSYLYDDVAVLHYWWWGERFSVGVEGWGRRHIKHV